MKRFDDELEFDDNLTGEKEVSLKRLIVLGSICVLVVGLILFLLFFNRGKKDEQTAISVDNTEKSTQIDDIENQLQADETEGMEATETMGQSVEGQVLQKEKLRIVDEENMTDEVTYGIDVAKYQGAIKWDEVAGQGIDFAMIRVGYRTQESGEIMEDPTAKYNMQEAAANGIQIGVYFFSTAITEEEAKEEADWVADYVSQYPITYPVAYNCEGFEEEKNRQYSLTQAKRSDIAMAFLERTYENGYTPMFYAPRNELLADEKWDTTRIEQKYMVWLAWYPTYQYQPENGAEYTGQYKMWQYTNASYMSGISENVDADIAFFGYKNTQSAKSSIAPEQVGANVEALMNFAEINESVTAKDEVNLRDIPSQGDDSKIMLSLKNGEIATRTGISNSGWSRVEYNGGTYYAVSSYLTTDLSAPAQSSASNNVIDDDGIKTEFTPCNELVTPKIEINLRALPSVTNPDAVVVATIKNGEVITRTGINYEYGWSRVEYNGQTLYCVSSYLVTQ